MGIEQIALCVIADEHAIEDGIERMLRSAAERVHGVFIAYTGDKEDEALAEILKMLPEFCTEGSVIISAWNDDFSQARNASFNSAYRHMQKTGVTYDWLFWMDCDDILPKDADLQEAIAICRERHAHGAFFRYDYQTDPDTGLVLISHWKERLFRTDVDWHWRYPCHENCVGPTATRMTKIDCATVRHMRGDAAPKRDRNRRIVAKWYKERHEDEPRSIMFLAHETFAQAMDFPEDSQQRKTLLGTAIKLYKSFIEGDPATDDSYACNNQIAYLLGLLGAPNEALNIYLQSVKMQPTWPAAYCGIAEIHHRSEGYEAAIDWARLCRAACSVPDSLHVFEPLDLVYKPLMIEANALRKLGRFDEALECYISAQEIFDDPFVREQIAETKLEAESGAKSKDAAGKLRKNLWGSRLPAIAFFTGNSFEPWNPRTLHTGGHGGTETTVIRLAQEFAQLGWRTVVFGTPGDHIGVDEDGIEWYDSGQFHPDEPFSAVVSIRVPELFDANINAQVKILWLHDMSMGDIRYQQEFGSDRFSEPDVIVCPSVFHAKHLMRLYGHNKNPFGSQMFVIPNGFDREMFLPTAESNAARDLTRMVYASSPDRGLERLLDLWMEVEELIPGASLRIFYGWNAIDKLIALNVPHATMLKFFKARVVKKLSELQEQGASIKWIGRIPPQELAEEFKQAGVMPYPASFCETHGLSFLQAMAAGVVPVVPMLGNLPDLVGDVGVVVPGPPDGAEYGPRFLRGVEHAVNCPQGIREELSARTADLDWPLVMNAWVDMISSFMAKPGNGARNIAVNPPAPIRLP